MTTAVSGRRSGTGRRLPVTVVALVVAATACGSPPGRDLATTTDDPTSAGDVTQITVATPDGEELAAFVHGDPAGAPVTVVFAHMRGSDHTSWESFASRLTGELDASAVTFDFRGYGDSTGERDTRLDTDLDAVVGAVRRTGARSLVLVGASMGGTAVLAVGPDLEAAALVALSAPTRFGDLVVDPTPLTGDRPVVLVAARDDHPYVDDLETLAAATGARLVVYEGGGHGTQLLEDHGEALTRLLFDVVATAG